MVLSAEPSRSKRNTRQTIEFSSGTDNSSIEVHYARLPVSPEAMDVQ